MRKLLQCLVFLISALLVSPASGSQAPHPKAEGLSPDAPAYARHGPYWVGTRDLAFQPDPGADLAFQATLWYPAWNPQRMDEAGASAHGIPGAPPDPSAAPYPLVVFVHGWTGIPSRHSYHLARLASHGFVVLGVHYRSSFLPSLIRQSIDFAARLNEPGAPLANLIDPGHVAVEGYSLGGQVTLQLGGACAVGMPPGGAQDPRVKAILVIAPAMFPLEDWNVGGIKLPSLVMLGQQDTDVLPLEVGKQLYESLPAAQKSLVVFLGYDHYFFIEPPEYPGTREENRLGDLLSHFATAFLLSTLKGEAQARQALLPGAASFKEVQYATTLK